jgi:hypothetical protein
MIFDISMEYRLLFFSENTGHHAATTSTTGAWNSAGNPENCEYFA